MSDSKIRLIVIIAVVVALMATASTANAAKPTDPLIPVWDAINILQSHVSDLYNITAGLQNQISNIQLIPGQKGEKGLACWDLNGDGVGNIPEDINLDGNYDTLDCKGTKGDIGSQGLPGISGYEVVYSEWKQAKTAGFINEIFLPCPNGKTPLNGDLLIDYGTSVIGLDEVGILQSVPRDVLVGSEHQKGWFVQLYWGQSRPINIRAYAICANIQ